MKPPFPLTTVLVTLFLFSCHGRDAATGAAATGAAARDSSGSRPMQFVEMARLDLADKAVALVGKFPDVQYIGYDGQVLQPIRAHRVVDGRADTSLVAIPAGAKIHVDTLYRALGKVRLRLQDATEVEIKVETAKTKLDHVIAG